MIRTKRKLFNIRLNEEYLNFSDLQLQQLKLLIVLFPINHDCNDASLRTKMHRYYAPRHASE